MRLIRGSMTAAVLGKGVLSVGLLRWLARLCGSTRTACAAMCPYFPRVRAARGPSVPSDRVSPLSRPVVAILRALRVSMSPRDQRHRGRGITEITDGPSMMSRKELGV